MRTTATGVFVLFVLNRYVVTSVRPLVAPLTAAPSVPTEVMRTQLGV